MNKNVKRKPIGPGLKMLFDDILNGDVEIAINRLDFLSKKSKYKVTKINKDNPNK